MTLYADGRGMAQVQATEQKEAEYQVSRERFRTAELQAQQERHSLSGLDSREHHTPVLHSRSSPVPWAVPSRGQC